MFVMFQYDDDSYNEQRDVEAVSGGPGADNQYHQCHAYRAWQRHDCATPLAHRRYVCVLASYIIYIQCINRVQNACLTTQDW